MILTQTFVGLCTFVAIGAVTYAFFAPKLGNDTIATQRLAKLTNAGAAVGAKAAIQRRRRRAVVVNLEELAAEEKNRRKLPLDLLLKQAGLDWTIQRYYLMMASGVLVTSIASYVITMNILVTAVVTMVAPLVWPKVYVTRARERRIAKFLEQFPVGLDIIVRGLKAGLPIRTCLNTIATEAEDPLKAEFQAVMQAQAVGMTVADAVARMRLTVPSSETNFFITLIEVQQSAGSNLAETLGTLASMMRARKQMREKVKSLAAQPKTSAYIIGAVPLVVMGAVQFISPEYLEPLFHTPMGHVVLGACLVWAGLGVLLMRAFMNVKI